MYQIQIIKKKTIPEPLEKISEWSDKDITDIIQLKYSGKPFEPYASKDINHLHAYGVLDDIENKDEIIYEYTTTVQIKISKIKEL